MSKDKEVVLSSELDGRDVGPSHRAEAKAALNRMGKKQVLRRNFSFLAVLGFSCTVLVTWEGILGSFVSSLANGGPAGAVYGFIFSWLGTLSVFVQLSELVSMAPIAGGQYHWSSMMSGRRVQHFSSYITGWFCLTGWIAVVAASSYLTGTYLQGMVVLTRPDYHPQPWHTVFFYWSVLAFVLIMNVAGGQLLPKFEGFILFIHILGFFGILIPMVHLSNHRSVNFVFETWINSGGFPDRGLSFLVGLTGVSFAFGGGDAAVHIVEETERPNIMVPRSLMLSVFINGLLGFSMLIATLFCIGNFDQVLNSPTGYPFMAIFYQSTGSVAAATVMSCVLYVMSVAATCGMLASGSRVFWAFSRDRAVPGHRWWSRVHPSQGSPINSVLIVTFFVALLGLVPLGSSIAFNQMVSMANSLQYISYLIVSILLLWRRLTGGIISPTEAAMFDDDSHVNTNGARLVWGPFHIPGFLGAAVNMIAISFLLIIIFFSFWPPTYSPNTQSFNYAVVGTACVWIIATTYYILRARHIYKGPVIEV